MADRSRQEQEAADAAPADDTALKGAGGAALLGGLAGAVIMGPLTAVALAGAGAAAAAGLIGNKDTEALVQATGSATVDAGRAGYSKAKEMDSRYHLLDKAKAGLATMADKAQELNDKHHITDKVAAGVMKGAAKVSELTKPDRPPPPSH
mmetsp:Transcript_7717/g.19876  ORF Transcript_7717/g.19876 Transcript_7717/m.19876 type:complete len:150 (+) Transcript_7717:23-472(+)